MRPARAAALILTLGALAAPGDALTPPERPLVDGMRSVGMEQVERLKLDSPAVRGVLPGTGELTVLVFAGCGPGGEASRGAALAAVADLARTPRRHTLEVVLCVAGGASTGSAARAASSWLALHAARGRRDAVLAALHLEIGERRGGPVGLTRAASGPDGHRLPPAWLAHAALRGADAGGGMGLGEGELPLIGQLLGRHAKPRVGCGAVPFLGAGVPALTLSGGSGEARWPSLLAGIVRRLDSLAGRPRGDDVYLALGGRVLARRDLYWLGLALWIGLVVRGLPGAWRGAAGGQRRRRGRRYLPGFLFRLLFLVALLLAPASTLVLLAPAALLTLLPLCRPAAVAAGRALALLPPTLLLGTWLLAAALERVAAWPAQPLRLGLVLGGVALSLVLIGSRQTDPGRPSP